MLALKPHVALIADAELPDPGEASIVPIFGAIGTVLGGAYGFFARGSAEEAEHTAFVGGLFGAALGLLAYLALLIAGVP
jgi:hypothetical protein